MGTFHRAPCHPLLILTMGPFYSRPCNNPARQYVLLIAVLFCILDTVNLVRGMFSGVSPTISKRVGDVSWERISPTLSQWWWRAKKQARTGIRCGRQLQARRDPPMMMSAASVATGISQGKSKRCSSAELCGRTSPSLCARQFIRVCILASSLCRKDGV